MTHVVAFDNSPLSRAALRRATAYGGALGEEVVAVTAIRRDAAEARRKGWLDGNESFSVEGVAKRLTKLVSEIDPDAEFAYRAVDKYAPPGRVSRAVRDLAVDVGARVVFVGSDNAGKMVGGITSVGQNVSADGRYDVHLVRHADGA